MAVIGTVSWLTKADAAEREAEEALDASRTRDQQLRSFGCGPIGGSAAPRVHKFHQVRRQTSDVPRLTEAAGLAAEGGGALERPRAVSSGPGGSPQPTPARLVDALRVERAADARKCSTPPAGRTAAYEQLPPRSQSNSADIQRSPFKKALSTSPEDNSR